MTIRVSDVAEAQALLKMFLEDLPTITMTTSKILSESTIAHKLRIDGHTIPCTHCHRRNARVQYPGKKPICFDCFEMAVMEGWGRSAYARMRVEVLGGLSNE